MGCQWVALQEVMRKREERMLTKLLMNIINPYLRDRDRRELILM